MEGSKFEVADEIEGIIASIKYKFADYIAVHLESMSNIGSGVYTPEEIKRYEEMSTINTILNDKLLDTQPQELEMIRIKLENYFPDDPIDLVKIKKENLDDSEVEFVDEVIKGSDDVEATSVDQSSLDDSDTEIVENQQHVKIDSAEEKVTNEVLAKVKHEPNVVEPLEPLNMQQFENLSVRNDVKMEQTEDEPPPVEDQGLVISHVESRNSSNQFQYPEMMKVLVANRQKYVGPSDGHVKFEHVSMGRPWTYESYANDVLCPAQFRPFDVAEIWNYPSNTRMQTARKTTKPTIDQSTLENKTRFVSQRQLPCAKKTTTKNENYALDSSTSQPSNVAKKSTKPTAELFGGRPGVKFNPRDNAVALGKAKKEQYVANYLKIPKVDRAIEENPPQSKSTSPDVDQEKKLEQFKTQESIRKKIISEAGQTRDHSPPPPKRVTRSSAFDMNWRTFYDDKVNRHLRAVKVLRLEEDTDPTVTQFYSDFVKRRVLNKFPIQVKIEPEEYEPRPRSDDDDDGEQTIQGPLKDYPWQAEDEMWANLLDEVEAPPAEDIMNKNGKRGKKGARGRPRGSKKRRSSL